MCIFTSRSGGAGASCRCIPIDCIGRDALLQHVHVAGAGRQGGKTTRRGRHGRHVAHPLVYVPVYVSVYEPAYTAHTAMYVSSGRRMTGGDLLPHRSDEVRRVSSLGIHGYTNVTRDRPHAGYRAGPACDLTTLLHAAGSQRGWHSARAGRETRNGRTGIELV